jgi:hypothetical protein
LHILQTHPIELYAAAVSQVTVQKGGLEDMAELLDMADQEGKDQTAETVVMVEMQMVEKAVMVDVVETQQPCVF